MDESNLKRVHDGGAALEAVILDLDGVVTRTMTQHRAAWKETFDELLKGVDPDQSPFDADEDYRRYVDGKPRFEGVRSFLESRGIDLPEGEKGDTLDDRTVRGVGDTKNERFRKVLREDGAEVFEDALARIKEWRKRGIPLAIVSSSRNCREILESVDMLRCFDARVDGETLRELGIEGKPTPDMFLEAARRLGVPAERCVVFEDAQAGVEAGRRGGFGLVVGVDRGGSGGGLREHGADVVVRSLDEFTALDEERAEMRP